MSNNIAHALSGIGGGIISVTATYPLVVFSSKLQDKKDYKSAIDTFMKILRKEGIKGFYSGFVSNIFGLIVTNGVYYYFYESLKQLMTNNGKYPLKTLHSIISGTVAGAAVVLATHPIWTARISFQRKELYYKTKRPSTIKVLYHILKKEGVSGLYSGSKAAMILTLNTIVQYALFENLKTKIIRSKGKLKGSDSFFLGAFSKLIATLIIYPYMLLKCNLQLKSGSTRFIENVQKIYKVEGIKGLYKGLSAKLIQSVLGSAILFYAKDIFFDWSVWSLVVLGLRKNMLC